LKISRLPGVKAADVGALCDRLLAGNSAAVERARATT
jgi:hypothetical protein